MRTAIEIVMMLTLVVWAVSSVIRGGGKIGVVPVVCAITVLTWGAGRLLADLTL